MASDYRLKEVERLLTNYIDLQCVRHRAYIQVCLLDLEVAIKRLPQSLRQIMFLYGIAGWTSREAARLLGISHMTILNHYRAGLDRLVLLMNGIPGGTY